MLYVIRTYLGNEMVAIQNPVVIIYVSLKSYDLNCFSQKQLKLRKGLLVCLYFVCGLRLLGFVLV